MLFAEQALIGIAAVKTPFARRRRGEFSQAWVPFLAEYYSYKLGWVVVHTE